MTDEQKEAFRGLEASGYLPQLREFAMRRCAPFTWASRAEPQQPARILHNGTVCYVRTDQRDLAITAAHVFDEYKSDFANLPNVVAKFGGSVVDPLALLIDIDRTLDIATFEIKETTVNRGGSTVHTPSQWPPPPLAQRELVLYGGFPGTLREQREGQILAPFQNFIWLVTDVTDSNIIMHVDFPNLFSPGREEEPINENPGGISGGPVFRVIEQLETEEKRVSLELAGIVYEYYEPLQVMRARHIRHVSPDGTIRT